MTRTWLRLRGDGPSLKRNNLDRVEHLEYRSAGPRGDGPAAPATACVAFAGPEDAVARALGLADPSPLGPAGPTAELVAVPPPAPVRPEEVEPW